MIDFDDADQGEEPQLPPARLSSAFLCLVAGIWTIVLLAVAAAKTGVASDVNATLGSVAAVATIIIGFFRPPKRPTIDPKVTRRVATFFLIVDVLVSAGWFSWSRYQASDEASRLADVLSTVTLGQNIDVLPGHHATLDVAIAVPKDTILLVFQVVDHNADIGSCVPNTVLSVTPDTPGGCGGDGHHEFRSPDIGGPAGRGHEAPRGHCCCEHPQ